MLGTPSLKAKRHSQQGLRRSLYGAVDQRTQRWEKHSAKNKALKEKKKTLRDFPGGPVVVSLVGEL